MPTTNTKTMKTYPLPRQARLLERKFTPASYPAGQPIIKAKTEYLPTDKIVTLIEFVVEGDADGERTAMGLCEHPDGTLETIYVRNLQLLEPTVFTKL